MLRAFAPVVLALTLLAPSLAAAGQVLHLKDGSTLNGTIVSQQNGIIVFEGAVGRVEIPQSKVARIEYGAEAAPLAEPVGSDDRSVWQDVPETGDAAMPALAPAPAPRATPRPVAAPGASGFLLVPKLGYHQYGGAGWDEFSSEWRREFDGPTFEIGIGGTVHRAPTAQIQLFGMAGWYGGDNRECDEAGTERACLSIRFTNIYLHAGPRFVVPAGAASFYGQFAAGFHQSSARLELTYSDSDFPEDDFRDSNTDTRMTPSFQALLGGGIDVSPKAAVFLEGRFLMADGKFPDAEENIDMGGTSFLAGIAFRL